MKTALLIALGAGAGYFLLSFFGPWISLIILGLLGWSFFLVFFDTKTPGSEKKGFLLFVALIIGLFWFFGR